MGATVSDSSVQLSQFTQPPPDIRLYRRDGADAVSIADAIQEEYIKVRERGVSRSRLLEHMIAYRAGVWKGYSSFRELMRNESLPVNLREHVDPNHWYEINTSNSALFPEFLLDGVDELLPGRLFSCRMPRNVSVDEVATAFKNKVERNKIRAVLILSEKKEYEIYSGADLEAFYLTIGLRVLHRPIADFSVPRRSVMVQNINDVTALLAEGENVLVHCAGGSGRTGMVIAGVVRNVGVADPLAWVRRVRSSYVETDEQERFVCSLPLSIDKKISTRHPTLTKLIVARKLLIASTHALPSKRKKSCNSSDAQKYSIEGLRAVFELLDTDRSGSLSLNEITELFRSLGCLVSTDFVMPRLDKNNDGELSRDEFNAAMSAVSA